MITDIDKKYRNVSGIYMIKNITNNKVYIGSTVSLYNRYLEHNYALINGNHPSYRLKHAALRDGVDSFYFSVIEQCDKNIRLDREQYWLDYYKSYVSENGYNISPNSKFYIASEEVIDTYRKPILCYGLDGKFIKEYISIMDAKRKLGIDGIIINLKNRTKKASNYIFRYKLSDKYPLKIDAYVRTINFSDPETKNKKISEKLTGIKRSDSFKEKDRQTHLGRTHTNGSKEKCRQAHLGKPKQPQQIAAFMNMVEKSKKKVSQIDLNTGEILNTFNSFRDASNYLGGNNKAPAICGVCKGNVKSAYGYKWQYA